MIQRQMIGDKLVNSLSSTVFRYPLILFTLVVISGNVYSTTELAISPRAVPTKDTYYYYFPKVASTITVDVGYQPYNPHDLRPAWIAIKVFGEQVEVDRRHLQGIDRIRRPGLKLASPDSDETRLVVEFPFGDFSLSNENRIEAGETAHQVACSPRTVSFFVVEVCLKTGKIIEQRVDKVPLEDECHIERR